MNHGVLSWGSDCESCCVILSKWLWIMVNYAVKSGCESWCATGMLSPVVGNHWCALLSPVVVNCDVLCREKWLWIKMCYRYAESSGWESWYVMPNQWLWIMFCYDEPVVVNHCFFMLSQWLWIMVSDDEQVVVNHGVLCWASGCESWWSMLSQ